VVAGQVDHPGHGPVLAVAAGLPDVFIDPQRTHTCQAGRVVDPPVDHRSAGVPDGVPVHPEPAGDRSHAGVVPPQRRHRPVHRAGGQPGPRRDRRVGLGPAHRGAFGVRTAPDPLAPQHDGDCAEAGRVVGSVQSSAVAHRRGPARSAQRLAGIGSSRPQRHAASGPRPGAFGQSRAPGPLARLAGPLQSRSSPRAGLWCRRRP